MDVTFGDQGHTEFLGTEFIILDSKGRFNVPKKIKGVLEKKYDSDLIICFVKENFLIFYPQMEWIEVKKNWERLDPFDNEKRKRMRDVLSKASLCQMKSGKILITADQRKKVGLEKEAVLVGMSNTFEVWSKEQWEKESG